MTDLLFNVDSYSKEFTANFLSVTDNAVRLDRTLFYPGGGGQPCDLGTLKSTNSEFKITNVWKENNEVWHQLETSEPIENLELVRGFLDWERRYSLMRTHTALHVISGVINRDYAGVVTGGNMEPLAGRMDFEVENLQGSFAEFAEEVEYLSNLEIDAKRPITVAFLSRKEADQRPELIRTKVSLLPSSIKEVRVVEIAGLDIQADGGSHVANTSEIGRIKVIGHESKGKINKRLRIKVE